MLQITDNKEEDVLKELNDNENINESSLEDKEKNLQQKSLGMDKQTKNYYDNSNLEFKYD